MLDFRYNPGMKKLPESISQEIDLLKQNTLEKFSLSVGSLDDVFSLLMQSQAEVLRLKEELTLMRIHLRNMSTSFEPVL